MKFNMKAVAASVLFAVAGSSQAAIVSGYGLAGDGELFISIFRDNTSPESMIIDTDISLLGLRDGTVTGWTSSAAQTAAISAFLSTSALSDFRFNAGGVTDQTDIFDTAANDDASVVFSGNGTVNATVQPIDPSAFESLRQNVHNFILEINNAYPSTEVVTGLNPGDQGYHENIFLWSNHIGGMLPSIDTEGSVTAPLNLWMAYNADPDLFEYTQAFLALGQLNIDTATGVASLTTAPSAVPVPAAVWLLGSGLVGLVGVARRKV